MNAQLSRAYLSWSRGINYFDTAYLYPSNEEYLGRILEKTRCAMTFSSRAKLPQYLVHSAAMIDRYFAEELWRLRTDRIDYYLITTI